MYYINRPFLIWAMYFINFFYILGFAAAGCLHKKATVAGLKFWLNSAGIRTKAKDKKDELVKKALEKLGYPTVTEEECMAPIEQ